MVRIRLRRAGGKGQPTHRIVAANRESPRDGKFIEILGDYNPRTEPATIRVKEDRIYYWLSVGAQPSDAALQVLGSIGLMDRYQRYKDGEDLETLMAEGKAIEKERNVDPRTRRDDLVKVSKPKVVEETAEEEAPEAEAVEEPAAEEAPEVEAAVEETPEAVEETAPEAEAEEDPAPEAEVEEEAPAEEAAEEPDTAAENEVNITDAAKKLAEEAGIDISTVEGTGKDGAILKSDITKLIKD